MVNVVKFGKKKSINQSYPKQNKVRSKEVKLRDELQNSNFSVQNQKTLLMGQSN